MTDSEVQRFVRTVIDAEVASGHALLRRVPSTYTWKILDYVDALGAADRDALLDDFAANGVFLIRPARDPRLHAYQAGRPAYRRLVDTLPRMGDWKYADARMLRAILGDIRGKRPSPEFANLSPEIIRKAEGIQPVTAAELRREIKSVLAARFDAVGDNRGSGAWSYAGHSHGRPFRVQIDYGGRTDQLRYEVSWDDVETDLHARRLTYEGLTGFGQARWDFVTGDQIESTVRLLADLIARLVSIPDDIRRAEADHVRE